MNELTPEKAFELGATLDKGIGGEICAAIAMALDRCMDDGVHDQESLVITIRQEKTPWTSRYATLRQLPERRK
ncbi:MAG: hypothetical protein IAB78_03925 [Bacteroidetes bacterium]|uniref:Uncharacterized protein n=1 Tax=Candidatus Cryptobacteroides excrementavium TaxID=2840759 RepID=A0A9D9NRP1_9BACT|nr:hypothetical protein [Candidatus Cryptobacteroides excrementavium]